MKSIHWLQVFGCILLSAVLFYTLGSFISSSDISFPFLIIGMLLSLILIGIGEVARQLDYLIEPRNDKTKTESQQDEKTE